MVSKLVNWALAALCLLQGALSIVIHDSQNGALAAKLLATTVDDYLVIAHGDTQFWYPCTSGNAQCKAQTAMIRQQYGADDNCAISSAQATAHGLTTDTKETIEFWCKQVENNYANNVQSTVIQNLISALAPVHQPRAVLIAGDLTNHGLRNELDEFEKVWITPFDIRQYPGLGNHDYEINMNNGMCSGLHSCPNRMLWWLLQYGKKYSIKMDYTTTTLNGKPKYTGSFSMSRVLCTHTGTQCTKILNLNNRPDYTTSFEAELSYWTVTSSTDFLRSELLDAKASGMSVFIAVHHLGDNPGIIQDVIKQVGMTTRVIVVRAHDHPKHEMYTKCGIVPIPFIYAGSVVNNRFTAVKLPSGHAHHAEIYLMSANQDGSATIVQYIEQTFSNC